VSTFTLRVDLPAHARDGGCKLRHAPSDLLRRGGGDDGMARSPHPLGAPHQGRRLVEVSQHTGRRVGLDRRLAQLPARFAQQLRLLDDPAPNGRRAIPPGLVERSDLSCGERQPRKCRRQRHGIVGVGARHG
jgi:hypothetical protein